MSPQQKSVRLSSAWDNCSSRWNLQLKYANNNYKLQLFSVKGEAQREVFPELRGLYRKGLL